MTMSDTSDQVSAFAPVLESGASETGDADGQEVNKAKDPAADGGGSLLDILKRPSENCVVDDSLSQQNESQSKSKSKRGISFPPDNFVSGYCEPPDPWKTVAQSTPSEIAVAYKKSCEKHGTKPIGKVLQQIEGFACSGKREEKLVLKGEKLDIRQCEALEEILRRVQFKSIDLESCHLDDETAVVWFDMIEYYESTVQLNISYNKNISVRGWQSCSRLTRRTPCLTHLDLRNCDMNDRSIPVFGRALKLGCHITVLHMENMYLSGRSLIILVAALKQNETLQELFLADNRLMPTDGIQLGNLIKYNHFLTLLDLRNNHLQDVGVGHICDGLSEQNLDKGLRTLVLWNNQITYQAMASINKALGSTKCLETLNLGHNNVTNEGIHILKDGLLKSKSLMRLGLQSTRLTCEGAVALAEYLADSSHLLRLDLRENDIKTAGLMALSLALKVNESVTRMDIDKETKKESGMKDYAEQQRRLQQEIKEFLERNQRRVLEREEEERRQLEERAEAEMAARASAETQNVADHELAEVNDDVESEAVPNVEMLYIPQSPSAGTVRRPSLLLMESHILTPQETLESPLCTDIHVTSFATSSRTREAMVPEVALSVSSPPLSLELQNPLTAQLSATLSSQTGTSVTAGAGDGSSLVLPLANPLVTALRSPPVELLLSPQYYPKPTARRIFSVTRVVENLVPASPTVSQTGLLNASQVSPAVAAPAVQQALMEVVGEEVDSSVEGSGGGHSVTSTPSPMTPQLLMQDLSMKTVNEYIQQIVSETVSIPIVGPEPVASDVLSSALSERPEVSSGELTPSSKNVALSSVMSGDVPKSMRQITGIESEARKTVPRTWGLANSDSGGDDDDDVFALEDEQREGRLFRRDHGAFANNIEEDDVHPDLDPLGVLKSLVNQNNESYTGYADNTTDARNHVSLLRNKDTKSENIGCDSVMHKVQGSDMSEAICCTRDISDSLQSRVEYVTAHKSDGEFQVGCEGGENVHVHASDDDSVDHNCGCSFINDSVEISKSVNHGKEAVDFFDQKALGAHNIPSIPLSSPSLANSFPASDASVGLSDPLSQDLMSELLELDGENAISKLCSNADTAKESSKGDQISSGKYHLQNNVSSLLPFDNVEGSLFKESALLTQQGIEESPLFKAADRVAGFEFSTEDLSLFEPMATASTTAFRLSVPSRGAESSLGKESEREISPGAGDSWLTVDASSCSEAGLDCEGAGVKKEPELFTLLSHNGLTQELALALNSTDDAEIHVRDEFERELDAMLASVKSDLPWPLQQDQLIVRTSSKHQDGEAENSKLQQPFAC